MSARFVKIAFVWLAATLLCAAQAPAEPSTYQAFCKTRELTAPEKEHLSRLVQSAEGRILPDRAGDRAGLLLLELPSARLSVFQRDVRRFEMLRSTPVELQRRTLQVGTCRFLVEFEVTAPQEASRLLKRLGFEILQIPTEYQKAFIVRKSIDPRKAQAELAVLKRLPGVAYAVQEVLIRSRP